MENELHYYLLTVSLSVFPTQFSRFQLIDFPVVRTTFLRHKLVQREETFYSHIWSLFFLFEMVRDRRVLYKVQLTRPPLTELNQCAFTSDSYLMFEPSRQQGCTTLGAFVLKTKPHFSTPFFVSVWYKSQVVQFERNFKKSRDINKKSRYRKKFKLFCLSYTIFIAIKSVYLARVIGPVKCPICRGSRIIRRLGLGFCYIKAPLHRNYVSLRPLWS